MLADSDKKDDIYRYDMMMPFQGKWDCYHIPLKPKFPGGYDIIMANNRLGIMAPSDVDSDIAEQIEQLENQEMWESCNRAIEEALTRFENQGIELKVQEYLFTILLANPQNAYTIMNEGYCGDGGIPGYIMGWLVPSKETIKRLPAALTHETNHNIRYQYTISDSLAMLIKNSHNVFSPQIFFYCVVSD